MLPTTIPDRSERCDSALWTIQGYCEDRGLRVPRFGMGRGVDLVQTNHRSKPCRSAFDFPPEATAAWFSRLAAVVVLFGLKEGIRRQTVPHGK